MRDRLRMFHWLLFSLVFYGLALYVFNAQPQLQTLCWKLGNLTVAAFTGYWVDRALFWDARVTANSNPLWHIRRAIIMAAAMLSISMGL